MLKPSLLLILLCGCWAAARAAYAEPAQDVDGDRLRVDAVQLLAPSAPGVDASLTIAPEGIRFQNESMTVERLLPWPAITRLQGQHWGHGRQASRDKYFSFLRITMERDRVPSWTPREGAPKFHTLTLRLCCTRADAQAVFDHLQRFSDAFELKAEPR